MLHYQVLIWYVNVKQKTLKRNLKSLKYTTGHNEYNANRTRASEDKSQDQGTVNLSGVPKNCANFEAYFWNSTLLSVKNSGSS